MAVTARSAADKLKEVLEELTCAICLELFTEPRLLPCSHTFCYACMRNLVRNQHVKCPTCRKVTLLQEEGLRCLPRNRALSNIVNKLKDTHPEHCSVCRELLATVSCAACGGKFYCDDCSVKTHARVPQGAPAHVVEKVPTAAKREGRSDAAVLRASYKCPVHSYKEVRFFCLTDGACVCKHCILKGDHLGHRYVLLKEGAMRARTALYSAIRGAQGLTTRLEEAILALRIALFGDSSAGEADGASGAGRVAGEAAVRGRDVLCLAREVQADVQGGMIEAERVIREGDCLSIIQMRDDFDGLLKSVKADSLLTEIADLVSPHSAQPAAAAGQPDSPADSPAPAPIAPPSPPERRPHTPQRPPSPQRASSVLSAALQRAGSFNALSDAARAPPSRERLTLPALPAPHSSRALSPASLSSSLPRDAGPLERPRASAHAAAILARGNSGSREGARSLSQSPRHQRPSGDRELDSSAGEEAGLSSRPGRSGSGGSGGMHDTFAPLERDDSPSPSPGRHLLAQLRSLGGAPSSSPNLLATAGSAHR